MAEAAGAVLSPRFPGWVGKTVAPCAPIEHVRCLVRPGPDVGIPRYCRENLTNAENRVVSRVRHLPCGRATIEFPLGLLGEAINPDERNESFARPSRAAASGSRGAFSEAE